MIRIPIAPRQRPDPRRGTTRDGRHITHNDEGYATWLQAASLLVRNMWSGRGSLSGPVALEVEFVVPAPKREAAKLAGMYCAKRPDLDRYVHAIQDAMTQASNVWGDDAQVAQLHASKRYPRDGERPSILIHLQPVELKESA